MLALTRVVMNPGDSRTSTVSLPMRRETSSIAASVAGALCDAERGGVGGDDRGGGRVLLDLREQRELEIDLLGRRLDHDVGVVERFGEARRDREAAEHRVGLAGRHFPELHALA